MTEETVHTHAHTHTHTHTHTQDGGREVERGEVSPDCCQSRGPVGGPRRQADRREL